MPFAPRATRPDHDRCMAELTTTKRDKLRSNQFAYVDRDGEGAPPDPRRVARPERDRALQPDRFREQDRQGQGPAQDPPGGESGSRSTRTRTSGRRARPPADSRSGRRAVRWVPLGFPRTPRSASRPFAAEPRFIHALTGPRTLREGLVRRTFPTVSFAHLGLSPDLLRAVADSGYTEPTPSSARRSRSSSPARPARRRPDGTGKTAAFVLPILQRLACAPRPPTARASSPRLVLVPDPRAGLQVEESVRTYGRHRPDPVDHHLRRRRLRPAGARAARAAPRSWSRRPAGCSTTSASGTIDLSRVEVLVLDEADRMLDMGFIRDIRRILAPSCRRAPEPAVLGDASRRDPRWPTACSRSGSGPGHAAQHAGRARRAGRPPGRPRAQARAAQPPDQDRPDRPGARLHPHQARRQPAGRAARARRHRVATRSTATRASRSGRAPWPTSRPGASPVLVATEVAARGLDIEALPHVVNFELPMVPRLRPPHRPDRAGRCRRRCRLARLRRTDAPPPKSNAPPTLHPGEGHPRPRAQPPPAPPGPPHGARATEKGRHQQHAQDRKQTRPSATAAPKGGPAAVAAALAAAAGLRSRRPSGRGPDRPARRNPPRGGAVPGGMP